MLRVGVLGLGRIGAEWEAKAELRAKPATHVGAWFCTKGIDLVAVCDANPHAGEKILTGAKRFTDYKAMFEELGPLDIVSVATPARTHANIVWDIATQKLAKLIFCEKPLSPDLKEAAVMVAVCKENGVKLAVNYTRRWDGMYRHVADKIASGVYGEPLAQASIFTGDYVEVGSHMSDLLNWYGVDKVPSLTWEMGALGLEYLLFELTMFFEKGVIRIPQNGAILEEYLSKPSPRYSGIKELAREPLFVSDETATPILLATRQLARCVDSDEQPYCTGEDGLKALSTALAWQGESK